MFYKVGYGIWVWSVTSGESLVEGDREADEQAVGKKLRIRTEDALKTGRS